MTAQLRLGDLSVEVTFKNIKNVHLSVHPPAGRVSVAAPSRMNLETVRVYTIAKLGWIRRQQRKVQAQARETPREYVNRESHYVWGKRYLLSVVESDERCSVALSHTRLQLRVSRRASVEMKRAVLAEWYREQIKAAARRLIMKWAPTIGVVIGPVHVRQMKTKWGSCNPRVRSIRLNTELAKKPKECLEYVVVHEMVHLVHATHNAHFIATMDRVMPNWRARRGLLNELPLSHEEWTS